MLDAFYDYMLALDSEEEDMVFLIELSDLKGRERLSKYDVASVVKFEGE